MENHSSVALKYEEKFQQTLHLKLFDCFLPKLKYKCHKCSFETDLFVELRTHLKNGHTVQNIPVWPVYNCKNCHFETYSQGLFILHKNSKKCSFKCDSQSIQYTLEATSESQQITSKKTQWFKCAHCAYKTTQRGVLKRHFLFKHANSDEVQWLQCKYCPHKTKQKHDLTKHIISKHSSEEEKVEWLHCEHCLYKSKDKSYLRRHVLMKHLNSEKWFKCERNVKKHLKSQDGVQWIQCKYCFYKSKRKCDVVRHNASQHLGGEKVKFQCDICPYGTKHKYHFDRHMDKHTIVKEEFNCTQCSYASQSKSNFQRHITAKHTPEKIIWLRCAHCPYITKQKHQLERHLVKHAPSQLFRCTLCPYNSKNNYNLDRHMMKHNEHNAKNTIYFQCRHCPLKFKYGASLKRHVITKHLEPDQVQWFKCKHCMYKSKIKDDVTVHQKRHVTLKKGRSYQCEHCPCKFLCKSHLNKHFKEEHEDSKNVCEEGHQICG